MKCIICNREFEPMQDVKDDTVDICDNCAETRDELTNGKGDD